MLTNTVHRQQQTYEYLNMPSSVLINYPLYTLMNNASVQCAVNRAQRTYTHHDHSVWAPTVAHFEMFDDARDPTSDVVTFTPLMSNALLHACTEFIW